MSDLSDVYRINLNRECLRRGWISRKDPESGSPSDLVRLLGRSSSFWSDRLRGLKPISTDLAYEIEDALDLGRLTLAGDEESQFVSVQRINTRLSAGHGAAPQIEEVIGHLKFARDFLRSCGVQPANARVVDVRGHSMDPSIKDGAVLLISTSNKEPVENQIFAMYKPSEGLIVKRLVRVDGQWIARSDNREFPDTKIDNHEHVTLIGRAIWMGAKL